MTYFVHANQSPCPTNSTGSGGGGGSGGPPPLPSAALVMAAYDNSEPLTQLDSSTILFLADRRVYPPYIWDLEQRSPHIWELENRPPLPWEEGAMAAPITEEGQVANMLSAAANGHPIQLDGPQPYGSGGSGASMGFYHVVRDGVHITQLTNLTGVVLSNTINIAFEAGNTDWNSTNVLGILESATLVVDGVQFPADAVLSASPAFPWAFAMDTGYLENGDHSVWVQVKWENPDSTDNRHPFFTRYSDAFTMTVSNAIYYPKWEPEIGEKNISAYFAKSTCMVTDWQIDIYDARTNLVKTLPGHTTDGTITAYWNMVDRNNVVRTNADLDPWFDSIITVFDPATKKTPRKNQRRKDWPNHGTWVVAYQDFFKWEYDDQNYMKSSLNSFAGTAQAHGGYLLYYPQPGQTNDIGQTYPIRFQKTNHNNPTITDEAIAKDHKMLLGFLTNSATRNFYCSSHGSPSTIAGGFPAAGVKKYAKQRYRFVFLDGCDTANGDWDKAFGINGPGTFDITYYQATGIRPTAFCGYNRETEYAVGGPVNRGGVLYDDTIAWQAGGFILNFLFYWDAGEFQLQDAFNNARRNLPPINGWFPGDGLQVYGFTGLGVDSYNHKVDWQ